MSKSLLDSFGSIDQASKDVLADTNSPRTLAFLALYIAKRRFNLDNLSAEHIIACLESAGVAVTRTSAGRALAGAKGFVTRSINEDGEVFYRLMTRGEREAEKILSSGSGLAVLRIEGGQPRQARLRLGEILKSLKGIVRICDPFYGVSTLDSLDSLSKTCNIKFLSQKTNESSRKISGALRDFYKERSNKERSNVEFRIAPKTARLHDRYIVTKQELLILGHGLKDIGNKESFVIVLEKSLVPDLIDEISSSFDKEWEGAKNIK